MAGLAFSPYRIPLNSTGTTTIILISIDYVFLEIENFDMRSINHGLLIWHLHVYFSTNINNILNASNLVGTEIFYGNDKLCSHNLFICQKKVS